jgi:hypothetical protein
MVSSSFRASDADRDRAVEILNNALVNGQLTPDEHEERLQAALNAATVDELGQLTGDVSRPTNPPPTRWRRGRFFVIGTATAAIVITAILVTYASRRHVVTGSSPTSTAASPYPRANGVVASPVSASVDGLEIQVVPPGNFAQHDPADECGAFGAYVTNGGANCYLVVAFINTGSSTVSFTPADLRMVDESGDTYSIEPVFPICYDNIDVHASASLSPNSRLFVQVCYPVQTGALPQALQGSRSLSGVNLRVPQASIRGLWGGA